MGYCVKYVTVYLSVCPSSAGIVSKRLKCRVMKSLLSDSPVLYFARYM